MPISKYDKCADRLKELFGRLRDINDNEVSSLSYVAKLINDEFGYKNRPSVYQYVKITYQDFIEEDKDEVTQVAEQLGLNRSDLSLTWIKTKRFSASVKQNPIKIEDIEKRFESIIKDFKPKRKKFKAEKIKEVKKRALKAVVSDEHVGMDVSDGLFNYDYNQDVYTKNFQGIYPQLHAKFDLYGKFDLLMLDNYGDTSDGWRGQTERGGHDLPQNMQEDEVFEAVLRNRLDLIDNIIANNIANRIIIRDVLDSNHGATFDSVINRALKLVVNRCYDQEVVEVDSFTDFIEYREYGVHGFAVTHGKDSKHMKRGLPYELTPKAENFLNDFLNSLETSAKYIHIEKGDLHQVGHAKRKRFNYRNYCSFAPPSPYVQLNYGDSTSGYAVQVIDKHSQMIDHTDIELDYSLIKNKVKTY